MLRFSLLTIGVLGLLSSSCKEQKSTEAVADGVEWVINPDNSTFGKIKETTTERELKSLFGSENIVTEEELTNNGQFKTTKIFPKTKNEITIIWKDEEKRDAPAKVILKQEKSEWKTSQGFTVGFSVAQLEKLNKKPFKVEGFEFEPEGTITGFQKGALEASSALVITLKGKKALGEAKTDDGEFLSTQMGSTEAKVSQIELEF